MAAPRKTPEKKAGVVGSIDPDKATPADVTLLTREEMLAGLDPKTKLVYLPSRQAWVNLRELWAYEKEQLDGASTKRDGESVYNDYSHYKGRAVIMSMIDAEGRNIFTDPLKDYEVVAKNFTSGEMDLMWEVAAELSVLTKRWQQAQGKESSGTKGTGA